MNGCVLVSSGADPDDPEVTYAEVSMVQRPPDLRRPQSIRRAERHVEYGEVSVSKVKGSGGQHSADPTEEDCVYAKVNV